MAGRLSKGCQTEEIFYTYKLYKGKGRTFLDIQIDDTRKKTSDVKTKANKKDGKGKEILKAVGVTALKTAGISLGIMAGTAIIVPLLGFGAAGITAGSLAAQYQSMFLRGVITAGSTFAKLQSVGAAGLAASTQAGITVGSGVVASIDTIKKFSKKEGKENSPKDDEDEGALVEVKDFGPRTRSVTTQTRFTMEPSQRGVIKKNI